MRLRRTTTKWLITALPPALFAALLSADWSRYRHAEDLTALLESAQCEVTATQVELDLRNFLRERDNDLALLSQLWQRYPPATRLAHFMTDASRLVGRVPCYHVINYVDGDSVIRASAPEGKRPELVGLDLHTLPGRAALHQRVRESGTPALSPPLTLTTGELGLVLWSPLPPEEPTASAGMLAGVFRVKELSAQVVDRWDPSVTRIRVSTAGTPIVGEEADQVLSVSEFALYGQQWQVSVSPGPSSLYRRLHAQNRQRCASDLAMSGIAACLLALAFSLVARERRSRRELRAAINRETALTTGLRGLLAAIEELLVIDDLDRLHRRIVELGREALGLERCSLYLVEGNELRGTYGTNLQGETIAEGEVRLAMTAGLAGWARESVSLPPAERRWHVLSEYEHDHWEGANRVVDGSGWVAVTPLFSGTDLLGVLFNDTAITHTPLDEARQQLTATYAALLASLLAVKAADQALRESEARYRLLAENASDVIFTMDFDLNWTYVSPSILQLRGYPAEVVKEQSFEEVVAPESVDVAREALREELELELASPKDVNRVRTLELNLLHRDGHSVPVEIRVQFLRDAEGNAYSTLGIARDISERKRADAALRRQTERLKGLRDLDQAILQATSPHSVAEVAVAHLRSLLGCQRVSAVLFDLEAGMGELLATATQGATSLPAGARFPATELGPALPFENGEIHSVEDLDTLTEASPLARRLREEGIRSFVSLPLMVAGELIGALNAGAAEPRAFDTEHLEIIQEVGNQLALALHQARLREQLEEQAQSLERRVRDKTSELRRFLDLMAGRENRMVQLKQAVRELREQLAAARLTPIVPDPNELAPEDLDGGAPQ